MGTAAQQAAVGDLQETGDTASSSSSRYSTQDAVILECERLRQSVERCGKLDVESRELQEAKVVVDFEMQSMSI